MCLSVCVALPSLHSLFPRGQWSGGYKDTYQKGNQMTGTPSRRQHLKGLLGRCRARFVGCGLVWKCEHFQSRAFEIMASQNTLAGGPAMTSQTSVSALAGASLGAGCASQCCTGHLHERRGTGAPVRGLCCVPGRSRGSPVCARPHSSSRGSVKWAVLFPLDRWKHCRLRK